MSPGIERLRVPTALGVLEAHLDSDGVVVWSQLRLALGDTDMDDAFPSTRGVAPGAGASGIGAGPFGSRPRMVAGESALRDAVEAWSMGEGDALSRVPVAPQGGPFARQVYQAMRTIPAGEPASYQELAALAGSPRAMRAVGSACARNEVGLFVPCHRVIKAGGRLGQYGLGGVGVKAALLAFEAGSSVAEARSVAASATSGSPAPTARVHEFAPAAPHQSSAHVARP